MNPNGAEQLPKTQTDEFYREIGTRIKTARELKGMSQEKIAASVGLSRTSLTNIERGKQKFLLHTFLGIASALGIPSAELLPTIQTNVLKLSLKLPSDQVQRDFVQRAFVQQALNPILPHEPASQNINSKQSKRIVGEKPSGRPSSKR